MIHGMHVQTQYTDICVKSSFKCENDLSVLTIVYITEHGILKGTLFEWNKWLSAWVTNRIVVYEIRFIKCSIKYSYKCTL